MFTPRPKLRTAAAVATLAVALTGLGAGSASATGWPPLQEGAFLYSGTHGTGAVTAVGLDGPGTCRTLGGPVRSVQIVSGSASLVPYPGADCTGTHPWASGSLAQSDLPQPALSYRVVRA